MTASGYEQTSSRPKSKSAYTPGTDILVAVTDFHLGRGYVFKGEYDLSVAALDEGLRRAESDFLKGTFHRDLAFAHMEAGREEEARRHMVEGQRLNTSTAAWYRNYYLRLHPFDRCQTELHRRSCGVLQARG